MVVILKATAPVVAKTIKDLAPHAFWRQTAAMTLNSGNLRAIDLYSGVGGWSLGLLLADVTVVASFERWKLANETNQNNNGHDAYTADIRHLNLADLPKNIDIVVGSPPCTQFSYSNRGGSGDIADGLQDIIKFFEIVDFIRPRFWAMENVPRVRKVIQDELRPGGRLHRFRHLRMSAEVFNMADFGLPQRRQRCIVGNFDFDLLKSYSDGLSVKTLGSVVEALATPSPVDPLYGFKIPKSELRDHILEVALDEEEERINRAGKEQHPVYNRMNFPDRLDCSVRTITATCTRVSRESIIIKNGREKSFRRLTVREKATLQGFPITYQFYAGSSGLKLRMVGNAMPPPFAYLIGHAIQSTRPAKLPQLRQAAAKWSGPKALAEETPTDRAATRFRANRSFRFAIPSLRLPSGVRFELTNKSQRDLPQWLVRFVYGNSKSIHELDLKNNVLRDVMASTQASILAEVKSEIERLEKLLSATDLGRMQDVWSHRGPGATRPFMLLDHLDCAGRDLRIIFDKHPIDAITQLTTVLKKSIGLKSMSEVPGITKLLRNSPLILSGLVVGSVANHFFFRTFGLPDTMPATTVAL